MNTNYKPKHFLICKILGFFFVLVAIGGIVLTIIGFGEDSAFFMIGGVMTTFGFFLSVVLLMLGFRPEIAKISTKTAKYIQEENKQDLSEMSKTGAEITSEGLKTSARAIKEGLKDTKYCKHCGAIIDEDSKFCKDCGKNQD